MLPLSLIRVTKMIDGTVVAVQVGIWDNRHIANEIREVAKLNRRKCLRIRKKVVPLQPGKSYTTSSPKTPPGLDRSNGIGL